MHVKISMILKWIIWQCFCVHLCFNLYESECDLAVKNLSLKISSNEVVLTWDCDYSMENINNISYDIYLKRYDWEYETNAEICEVKLTLPNDLPNTVCVMVIPESNYVKCENGSEICFNPGRNEIQCFVFNTSSMNCTWTIGKNGSYEAEYTLSLKQDATIKNCQQYVNDLKMRTGSCLFHDLTIDYFKDVIIILNINGSEGHVLKDVFKPAEKEFFNPPTNLTVRHSEENLIVSWNHPHTKHNVHESCFHYQMEKNENLTSVSNPQSTLNLEKECLIRIRASGDHTCGINTNWGQWSEAISCDATREPFHKTKSIIPMVLLGLSGFIIFLTIIISIKYKRLSKLLFPRVPQPKNYLDDTQDYETNTKIVLMPSVLLTSETEEYITLYKNNS